MKNVLLIPCLFLAACSSACFSDSNNDTSSTTASDTTASEENTPSENQDESEQGSENGSENENEQGAENGNEQGSENQNDETNIQTDPSIIALTQANWDFEDYGYSGYGSITFASDGITLSPKAATSSGETHAALILAKATQQTPVKDFTLSVELITETQLRTGSPANPWEVAWIFFNYLPVSGNKETNYFILKTNGIELGKAFESSGQDFLFTEGTPQLSLNTPYTISITKNGQDLTIKVNGETVLSGSTWTGPLYDVPGWIGIYTEDATVKVLSVSLS